MQYNNSAYFSNYCNTNVEQPPQYYHDDRYYFEAVKELLNNLEHLPDNSETISMQKKTLPKTVRLFVGGVPPDMAPVELRQLFLDAIVNLENFSKDYNVGRVICKKGFGFITQSGDSEDELLEEKIDSLLPKVNLSHKGIKFQLRLAVDKMTSKQKIFDSRNRKLMIINVDKSISTEKLEQYFSKFGKIEKAYILHHPITNEHRGFGFVIFTDLEITKKVLEIQYHVINGFEVIAKKNRLKDEENFIKNNSGVVKAKKKSKKNKQKN